MDEIKDGKLELLCGLAEEYATSKNMMSEIYIESMLSGLIKDLVKNIDVSKHVELLIRYHREWINQ